MTQSLVALVTGANQGIGHQIAKDLAARGLTVLVGARDLAKGEKAAKEIGRGARAIQLDENKPQYAGQVERTGGNLMLRKVADRLYDQLYDDIRDEIRDRD